MNPGKYLHIAADGETILPYGIVDRVTVNKAQSGAVIKVKDGTETIAIIDGNVVGTKEFMAKTESGNVTFAMSGFTTCDATAVVRNI